MSSISLRFTMARLWRLMCIAAITITTFAQTEEEQPPAPYLDPPEVPPASPYYDSVWAKVASGVTTECKTCPYPLCPNQDFYGSMYMFRASCWATGQKINSTSLWLKTEDNCYVTEMDTLKYQRKYQDDIAYCGAVPENVTSQRTTARQVSECRMCPNNQCEIAKEYKRRIDVTLTCRAQELPPCLGNCLSSDIPKPNASTVFPWYKTKDNCYVRANEMNVVRTGSRTQQPALGYCGPVPYLENSFRAAPPPPPAPEPTVCATQTIIVYIPTTTTLILRPPPCTTCPPLIFGYTPPMTLGIATRTSANAEATSTGPSGLGPTLDNSAIQSSSPYINSSIILSTPTPTSDLPITLKPTSVPIISIDPVATSLSTSISSSNILTSTISTPITPITSNQATNLSVAQNPSIASPMTSDPPITLTPTNEPPITLSPSDTSIITLTPTSSPIITLTPTSTSIITLTPTSAPIITLTPTSTPIIILPTNTLTLPPITIGADAVAPDSVIKDVQQTSTSPVPASSTTSSCTCQSVTCSGDSATQRLCSQPASEACTKTCSLSSTTGDPFSPLVSDGGGRPPPGNPMTLESHPTPLASLKAACSCLPTSCPTVGDEATACSIVRSAACLASCEGNMPATTRRVVWDSTTVVVVTQVFTPTAST
ncbi:hypothetical protein EJ08DRAFT_172477 [Tothia fuscella]|uniref:Uncharacterized protein n=1 Tax=Tothia fuscella TaxID=1048955 RepID=A0A9P4NU18_9PEZI|nr:hypothetical protein EJ08DRAFT_172477 [Tothia fuscella]